MQSVDKKVDKRLNRKRKVSMVRKNSRKITNLDGQRYTLASNEAAAAIQAQFRGKVGRSSTAEAAAKGALPGQKGGATPAPAAAEGGGSSLPPIEGATQVVET